MRWRNRDGIGLISICREIEEVRSDDERAAPLSSLGVYKGMRVGTVDKTHRTSRDESQGMMS